MAIEPLDSLTRVCLARQLSANTWLRLFTEAKAKSTSTTSDGSSLGDVCSEAIDTLLPLLRQQSPNSLLAQSYLQACLQGDGPKKRLLQKLLDSAAEDLKTVEEDTLAKNAHYESLAATLLASDQALVSKAHQPETGQLAAERLRASIHLLLLGAQNQLSSLFVLMLQLLQLPIPEQLELIPESAKCSLVDEIASCRNTLSSMTDGTAAVPYPFELASKLLQRLERVFDPTAYRRRTLARPVSFPSMPEEVEILLHAMMLDNCHKGLQALRGSIMARLSLLQALTDNPDAESRQEVLDAWLADLFTCCAQHLSVDDEPKGRTEATWRTFALGKLPVLLRDLQGEQSLAGRELDWSAAIDSGMKICLERRSKAAFPGMSAWVNKIASCLKVLPKTRSVMSDVTSEEIISRLQEGLQIYGQQQSAAAILESQMSAWVAASDLPALHHFLLSLVKESPRILDYVLLHCPVERLFKPVCGLIESWDNSDEYGAGQAMELYGGTVLALRTLVFRHQLQDSFASFGYSIVSALTASSSALGDPRPLQTLSKQHRDLVSAWISALYGSEGIEDDLIRSTSPRVMLSLAPTIVHQSMVALDKGVIDQETLLNGLSYFCQEFLTFTLPAIVSYLASRPQPSLQIIKSLLLSESSPACVFELVQDDLRMALKKLDSSEEEVRAVSKRLQVDSLALPLGSSFAGVSLVSNIDTIQSLRTAAANQGLCSLLLSVAQATEPLLASLLFTQARVLGESWPLSDSFRYAVKHISTNSDEEARQRQRDNLADIAALAQIRRDGRATIEGFAAFPKSFVERLATWTI